MCAGRVGWTITRTPTRSDEEHSMPLIQVKVIEGVTVG